MIFQFYRFHLLSRIFRYRVAPSHYYLIIQALESPLDCKEIKPVNPKGNHSWIFIGRTIVKLKLQYFGHLMQRANSLEKTLMMGNIEGRRRSGWQRMRWLDGIIDSMDRIWANSRRHWRTEETGLLQSMEVTMLSRRVGHDWVTNLIWCLVY